MTGKKRKKGGEVVPDTEAIIADFHLMGEGLVKSIVKT